MSPPRPKPKSSEPKRHHYLPQFYLDGFCRFGRLWVFDKKKHEFREQTPINTAAQNGYYTVHLDDGTKNMQIEKMLAAVEGQTKPIIDKLIHKQKITAQDKEVLATFTALMQSRVPAFEKHISGFFEQIVTKAMKMMFSNERYTEQVIADFEKKKGKKPPYSAKEWKDAVLRGDITVHATRTPSLHAMVTLFVPMTQMLTGMDWTFAYAPQQTSFVISDNPFILFPPRSYDPKSPWPIGVMTPGAKKILPLAQNCCLIIGDPGTRLDYVSLDTKWVQQLNRASVAYSHRFVIARDEALLRSVIKKIDTYAARNPST
jgi:hypothetical protein